MTDNQLLTPPLLQSYVIKQKVSHERDSNIELLRIVAMSMILIHHFVVHGFPLQLFSYNERMLFRLIDTFCLYGVDIYFLISGYFGIKTRTVGIIKFVLTVFAFGVANLILIYFFNGKVSVGLIINTIIFPISGTPYWFMKMYLLLMISAPLINAGLNALPKTTLTPLILILSAVIIYMRGSYASYNYLNAMLFYCIGYCCKTNQLQTKFTNSTLIWTYILTSCVWAVINIFFKEKYTQFKLYNEFSDYENICAFAGSISLFLMFLKFSFKRKFINKVATASLGCYLLQDGYFGFGFLYDWQISVIKIYQDGFSIAILWTLLFFGYWGVSYILTSFNSLWIPQASDLIGRTITRCKLYKKLVLYNKAKR